MLLRSVLILLLLALSTARLRKHSHRELPNEIDTQRNLYLKKAIYLYSYNTMLQEWKIFKETYKKQYKSDMEELERMEVFAWNRLSIAKHNDLYRKRKTSYSVKMNKFGDLTADEFVAYYGLNVAYSETENKNFKIEKLHPSLLRASIPDHEDWRIKGAVTEVKDQLSCGASWAFSATGALEGYFFRHNKYLLELSEQNLIDCSKENHGCLSGRPKKAFSYIQINKGIESERNYPYRGKSGKTICRYNSTNAIKLNVETYFEVPRDETILQKAVAICGPVSVLVDIMSDEMFQFYETGVFHSNKCSSKAAYLNHAMLVIGYGFDDYGGGEYWLVKNSWGHVWGEEGYIRMARNRDNNCGIATEAILPFSRDTTWSKA